MWPWRSAMKPPVAVPGCLMVFLLTLLVAPARADDVARRPVLDALPNGALEIEPLEQPPADVDIPVANQHRNAEQEIVVSPESSSVVGVAEALGANTSPPRRIPIATQPLPWYRSGLVSLAVVLAVIVLVALFARRLMGTAQASGAGVLSILSRAVISPKQSIALVQMGRRFAFVGITPERMTTLHVVEDDEEAACLRSELRIGQGRDRSSRFGRDRSSRFDDVLTGQRGQMAAHLEPALPAQPAKQVTQTRDDLKGLLQKLRSFGSASGDAIGSH